MAPTLICQLLALKPRIAQKPGVKNGSVPSSRFRNLEMNKAYRVNVMIQFVSQVLPASSENACSKRLESGVMSEKPLRLMMILPRNSSWS